LLRRSNSFWLAQASSPWSVRGLAVARRPCARWRCGRPVAARRCIGCRGRRELVLPPLHMWLAVLFAALGLIGLTRARAALPAGLVLVAGSFFWMLAPGRSGEARYEVRMLRVSEGMALLLRCGDEAALVDTGRSPVEVWRELARNRVRHLEALVVTHPDADHTGGAAMLLDRLPVRLFAFPEALGERAEIVPLRRMARLRGVQEVPLLRGQRTEIAGARWEVLWPPRSMEGVDNDASLVGRVHMGGPRLLISGDIEAPGEASLLKVESDIGPNCSSCRTTGRERPRRCRSWRRYGL